MNSRLVSLLMPLLVCQAGPAQTRMLDDFDRFGGWTTVVSEGARLQVTRGTCATGGCLVMDFDLSTVRGYVCAQKSFSIDLPADYQFAFDMKAEAQVNNFEFKLYDDKNNVFWIKKLNIVYPKEWTRQRIAKRQITFAWGPSRAETIRTVRKIEFVVSCGSGGKGKVFIDNLRLQQLEGVTAVAAPPSVSVSSAAGDHAPRIDSSGSTVSGWWSAGAGSQWLTVDFHRLRDVGGLVIDWDTAAYSTAYDVLFSDDGSDWITGYSVRHGNGGRDIVPTQEGQGRWMKLALREGVGQRGYRIRSIVIKPPTFSASDNDLYHALAAESPSGYYPKYFSDRQSYWNVMGVNGDSKEALINQQGQIEVDKTRFSLEPFLFVEGRLVTWSNVTTTQELLAGYLPIPAVTWNYRDLWTLRIEGTAAGVPGNSLLGIRYTLGCKSTNGSAKLFVAIRPFQVNPPWQSLNENGGVARIDSIVVRGGMIEADGITIVPMTAPSRFGATEFDRGDITAYLAQGAVPPEQSAHDHAGYASAALEYDVRLGTGQTADFYLAVPFHGWRRSPTPGMGPDAGVYYELMQSQTVGVWEGLLNRVRFTLPPTGGDVARTIRSNLAYILINRDGPGIQPGSRSYERSWIRDGSLTASALLRLGHADVVRQFIDWYAGGQFPSGKIPCVMDTRGPDAVPEHDSHGEFLMAVYQYFLFSRDTVWLRGKFEVVEKAVRYIQSLRTERKTDAYKNGTPQQRALYGLVPESISHEGYWDVPRHSYWDDFFVLRGLKDATAIAAALKDDSLATAWASERDSFRKDFYASVRQAVKNTGIDYVPGCAELGDFDATSTTIGVIPGGELGKIPEPLLHNTFDRYYRFFKDRVTKGEYVNYTPYETRVIGTFVALGQRDRAAEALTFFMNDRRPPAWNHWAEVVWRDPSAPKYIGDMPHTWVGSDFIRSVLTMFAYERESDNAIVLAAGIPEAWVRDTSGVGVTGLLTPAGAVNYLLRMKGKSVVADIAPGLNLNASTIVMPSPLMERPRFVTLNGKKMPLPPTGEIQLRSLPARIEFHYR
ncbi:MAG: discoidin domain-containing protein [Bacteroidota bacterium]